MNEPDPLLLKLVESVNKADYSFSITLTVSGQVISGLLIANHRWLRLTAEKINDSPGAEGGEWFASIFEELHEDRKLLSETRNKLRELTDDGALNESAVDAYDEHLTPGYIHLQDARYLAGSTLTSGVGHWRGRLTDVSGWNLGHMSGG